ncbi:TPA: hypothetical protein N2D99_001966 [Clostridium botulinum]|nr:hypothetical protein [Clostridium botulinum]
MSIKEYLGIAIGFALFLFIIIMAKPITYALINMNILEIVNIIRSFIAIGGLMFGVGCLMLMISDTQEQDSEIVFKECLVAQIGRLLFVLGILIFIVSSVGYGSIEILSRIYA